MNVSDTTESVIEPRHLLGELLAQQGTLTAVEEFAARHDAGEIRKSRYRSLLPTSIPLPGQQYAFEVNLDQCSGCKACVTACHSLNGLEHNEAWRQTGMLLSEDRRHSFQQTVTTACHHCVDPGCLNGCPVLAYEKDPVTGIVWHLDDQCIGCQYCVLKCPYEVPQYSSLLGIVRKCDMCSQRLAVGEAPACVQACPSEAIRITVVAQEGVQETYRPGSPVAKIPEPVSPCGIENTSAKPSLSLTSTINNFLPASPNPALTLPTTRFISQRGLPNSLVPGGESQPALQPSHWPLVWMLVISQFSVGLFAALPLLPGFIQSRIGLGATLLGLLGLAASIFHLGRPLKAWRVFLGLRRSWLSREIVVFGGFAGLAVTTTLAHWLKFPSVGVTILTWMSAAVGLAGVISSGMVYHDTGRSAWQGGLSVGRFLGTTAILGLGGSWLSMAAAYKQSPGASWLLPTALAVASIVKLSFENRLLQRAEDDLALEAYPQNGDLYRWSLARTARCMKDYCGFLTRIRFFSSWAGGIMLPVFSLALEAPKVHMLALVACLLCLLGELSERYLFFRCVQFPRMPGAA